MVGNSKSAILDENFLPRMLMQCKDDEERAWVLILYHSGCHGSMLEILSPENLVREGDTTYLKWRRPKTNRAMECELPADHLAVIASYLGQPRKKSLRWINVKLKQMGVKAGFDNISSMSFRHSKCGNLIKDGVPLTAIKQILGCTSETVDRAYGKFSQAQLRELQKVKK